MNTTRRRTRGTMAAVLVAGAALALAACGGSSSSTSPSASSAAGLKILIGSSGDTETTAVKDAVQAWSTTSGVAAQVVVASDLSQELSQGFASGQPADVFYTGADSFAGYAKNGSLLAYGDKLSTKDDFYPSLVEQFSYDGQFYCAPKDFSTLALVINTDDWAAAGLTEADIPTTWDQLAAVAAKLTTDGRTGLVFGGEYARLGAFMAQAGGGLISADGSKATADAAANVTALDYVKTQLTAGSFAYASTVGAGWGGEAFGKNLAAMTIEGNWITGGLSADYPDVKYTVVELPAGPAGKGTLQFTNCWGIAADSAQQDSAISLVEYLTSTDQQLAFSKAFGVMPSVESAAAGYKQQFPALSAFVDSATFAQNVVNVPGASDVISDFNSQLEGLATGDPAAILGSVQTNLKDVIDNQ
ncbi:MAG: extracellular solute-binding protein [Actinobacteria bacterium]|nr:extracellular solute-binding protein [Actinomycetota bacterium]MCG2802478.1 extracellular solute-binding protein [Cellulomonas sp.]